MIKLVNRLDKGLGGVTSFVTKTPEREEALRKALSYRFLDPKNSVKNLLGGTAIGSTTGGATGFLSGLPGLFGTNSGDKSFGQRAMDLASRAAAGAAVGVAPGAALGKWGPRLFQKGLGRVLTNTIDPFTYNLPLHLRELKKFSPREIAGAVLKDKPLNFASIQDGKYDGRRALFRDYFGLSKRPGVSEGSQTFLKQVGVEDGMNVYKFNPRNEFGLKEIAEINNDRVRSVGSNSLRPMTKGQTSMANTGTMANYGITPDGKYEDVWDFALNGADTKITDSTDLLRAAVSMFGTPSKIVGKTFNEGAAVRRFTGGLDDMVPSIRGSAVRAGDKSVAQRISEGAGTNFGETSAYLRKLPPEKLKAVKQQLSNVINERPANFLKAISNSEGVSPSEMRVLLGARVPRSIQRQEARQAAKLRPTISPDNMNGILESAIPGARKSEVARMLSGLTPKQQQSLHSALLQWVKGSKDPAQLSQSLKKTLGFNTEDLSVLFS